ncbi:MAG: protein translocase subunit SecF [Nanoarchaeota archaeon]|nr:protein translocase subunit SecF [Nanoarchaeota archaeon]MCA9496539.1 protein translocase subunit SecF [Nanoarchaeota archaeon]
MAKRKLDKKSKKEQAKKEEETKFDFYKKNYKKLMIIPVLFFILALIFIFQTIQVDGTPINRDISLKGGLSAVLNVDSQLSLDHFLNDLNKKYIENSFVVSEIFENGKRTGFIVDTDLDEDEFKAFVSGYFEVEFEFGKNYSSNFISPTLSSAFFIQAVYILIVSFVLMSAVIFFYFREFVPSFAVVLSALFDVIVTVGILDLFGVKISIAGIGALLMLIGYSIDTDVLLTNRLLKESGDNYLEKTFEAFKTGVLMTSTTLIAGIAALIITNSEVISEIALILVLGLIVDFVSTWIQNTGILLWWFEKRRN